MAKHKALGRGLDALLGGGAEAREGERLGELPVTALRPGKYQPRMRMDEAALAELAESIRARGLIQPVIVRAVEGGQYEILAGERRWRAARMAGLREIPAVVRDVSDEAALGISLVENMQREDLNPVEEATGLKRLVDEFGLTHEEAARAVGRSRVGVTNLMRLLELAPAARALLQEGRIDMGHARALLALSPARQAALAQRIAEEGLSVREAERLAQEGARPAGRAKRPAQASDRDTRRLEEELSESLGARVRVKTRRGGRGSLVIDYASLDQLDGVVARLKGR